MTPQSFARQLESWHELPQSCWASQTTVLRRDNMDGLPVANAHPSKPTHLTGPCKVRLFLFQHFGSLQASRSFSQASLIEL